LNLDSVNANNVNVTASFQVYAATSMSLNKALGGFGGAFYNTGQLNLSGLAIDKNQAKSGAAIFTAALGTSHYCTFDTTLSSSITKNTVVVAGAGYSIVDGSGADGYCSFAGVSASGNGTPKCKPSAVRPGFVCPEL